MRTGDIFSYIIAHYRDRDASGANDLASLYLRDKIEKYVTLDVCASYRRGYLMTQSFFADDVGSVVFQNGMVRIEFVTAVNAEKDGAVSTAMLPQAAMVMTPQGFVSCFNRMGSLVEKLKAAGVLISHKEERRSGPARETDKTVSEGKPSSPPEKAKK